jgi:hypothetical protein
MIKLLLARAASIHRSLERQPPVTALDLARQYNHPEAAALLEKAKPR